MKVTRNIPISQGVDISICRLCTYWEDRGTKFVECSETYLRGKRGSLLGKLFSFGRKHLISQIEIKKTSNCLECVLSSSTLMQQTTDTNSNFIVLELETFEKYLLSDDSNQKVFLKQRKESKRQTVSFVIWFYFLSAFFCVIIIVFFF